MKVKIKKKSRRYSFINKSLIIFAILLIATSAILVSSSNGLLYIDPAIINMIKFFLSCAIVIVITNLLLRLTVNRIYMLFEKELDIEQRILLTKLYTIFFYVFAISIILYIAGVGLTDITLFLGFVTTGIALAIRDIIMSFFIWLIILTKRPLQIGDVVTLGDDTGKVDRIGTFYVTLKVKDGHETHLVRVPNKLFLDRNMKNHGKNKISGEIKLILVRIPDDFESWSKKLSHDLESIDAEINTNIITVDKELQLSIRYLTDYDRGNEVRLQVLSLMFKSYRHNFRGEEDVKP